MLKCVCTLTVNECCAVISLCFHFHYFFYFTVDQCKRKWKNLRDAYRAEVRRSERRIERDKLTGVYDPQTNYNSKWVFFPSMSFISDIARSRRRNCCAVVDENTNSNSNGNNNHEHDHDDSDHERDDEYYEDNHMDDENFHSAYDIKLEPTCSSSHNVSMENNLHNLENTAKADEDEVANDMLFEEFQSIATPQAARRLSANLSMNKPLQQNLQIPQQQQQQNVQPASARAPNCKCSNRAEDQVHFLEDLGREEQQLIRSTRQDITRSNKLDHIGDSDYNFLVSFLPQMKKMSELQNLQFRARMCDMVLNIFAPPAPPPPTTTISGNMGNICSQPQQQQQPIFEPTTTTTCSGNMGNINAQQQQQPMEQSSGTQMVEVQNSVIMNNCNGANNNFN